MHPPQISPDTCCPAGIHVAPRGDLHVALRQRGLPNVAARTSAMLEAVGCLGESEKALRLAVRLANEVLPAVSVELVADEKVLGSCVHVT
jgi:hypothetical protein